MRTGVILGALGGLLLGGAGVLYLPTKPVLAAIFMVSGVLQVAAAVVQHRVFGRGDK